MTILFYGIVLLVASGCAVLDKDHPGWDQFAPLKRGSDVTLSVETLGEGRPVLLIHGFAANRYTWRLLAPELAKQNKVYMPDLKGFGESPKPDDGSYTVYDQARNVLNFIREEDLRDLVIVGHSFGGGVALVSALYMTRSMPGRLRKLVLIDSIGYPQELPFFIEVLATPVLGPLLAHLLPATFQANNVLKKAYFNDELITEQSINAYATPLKNADAVSAMLATARSIWPSDLERVTENYQLITVPTKIVWGYNDAIIPLEVGKRLHKTIPESTLDIIHQCGHIPHEECPDIAVPVIVNFIGS